MPERRYNIVSADELIAEIKRDGAGEALRNRGTLYGRVRYGNGGITVYG